MKASNNRHHFNGNHPEPLHRKSPYGWFRAAFNNAAPQLRDAGIEVINCTRDTALDCFPRRSIEDVL